MFHDLPLGGTLHSFQCVHCAPIEYCVNLMTDLSYFIFQVSPFFGKVRTVYLGSKKPFLDKLESYIIWNYCSKYTYHPRMTWILLALANLFYIDTNKYVDPCSKKWQTSITYFSVEMTGSQCGKNSWKGVIFDSDKSQVSFGNFSKFHPGILFFNFIGATNCTSFFVNSTVFCRPWRILWYGKCSLTKRFSVFLVLAIRL